MCVAASRQSRLVSQVSGSTLGVHAMTENLPSFLKTICLYLATPIDGFARSMQHTKIAQTLLEPQ